MSGRGFRIKVEIDLHAITCPGVWLCPSGKIALRISTLKSSIESHKISPVFPLLFHDKFTFEMIFPGITSLVILQRNLEKESLFAELIQRSDSSNAFVILATFETNLADLLYPSPCYEGLLAGVDVDLLMEPTKFFPGILAPKIEVSTKTVVEEVSGIKGINTMGYCRMNPKVLNSKNCSSINRKHPNKGIIRQRKVCHSRGKAKNYHCRPCRKPNRLKSARSCSPASPNRQTESHSDQCYHNHSKQKSKCCCSQSIKSSLTRSTSHKHDTCPVCLKYECYFSGQYQDREESSHYNERMYNSNKDSTSQKSSHRMMRSTNEFCFEGGECCICRTGTSTTRIPTVSVSGHRKQRVQRAGG